MKRFLAFLALFLSVFTLLMGVAFAETFDEMIAEPLIRLASDAPTAVFYIAPNGSDAWSGKLSVPNADQTDGPLATFAAARQAVRDYRRGNDFDGKPTIIKAAAGRYELAEPLVFGPDDSGTPEAPIVWGAQDGASVRLCASRLLKNPQPVTNSAILERLKPEVRDRVVQVDLKAQGITDFGAPDGTGPELFFDGKPMTVSRYPNDGFLKITDLVREGTTPKEIHGNQGIAEAAFYFDDDEPLLWEKESDAWVLGYWFWDWSNKRQKIESIDGEKKIMRLAPPNDGYGYRVGQWFYAYNLLCEIDRAGEYFIDRDNGVLYFYPPEELGDKELTLTTLPAVIKCENASNIVISGLSLEGARSTALVVSGDNLVVYNTEVSCCGGTGIGGSGKNITVFGCRVHHMGAAGLSLSGGDRDTLTSGRIRIVNNVIHDYGRVLRMYAAGVNFNGVGFYVANNKITDAPHCAILFGGNDNLIERNEITRVCLESNDAGAIYCGRNWTMRGNCVKNNYLHDITGFEGRGCVGVYLDDMFSSCDMIGNLFVNVTRAAMIGGGRDNHVVGNIFVNCNPSLHIDARALGWCAYHADEWLTEAAEKGTISGIAWNKPPYSDRYPELAKILDGEPKSPEGNVIAKNICVGGCWDVTKTGQWQGDSVEAKARPYQKFEDNLIDQDPMFVDAEHGNYNLRPESPAWKFGFEPIPFDQIGPKPTE